jgi:hypothetical protein
MFKEPEPVLGAGSLTLRVMLFCVLFGTGSTKQEWVDAMLMYAVFASAEA